MTMARPKRPPHPIIAQARSVLHTIAPELELAPLELRMLDGPQGGPRFAVAVSRCYNDGVCPHQVTDPSRCDIPTCDLRRSLRLLFDGAGKLIQVIDGHHRWTPGAPEDSTAQ